MKYNLYLDDERQPIQSVGFTNNNIYATTEWVIVRSYDQFVKCIQENGLPVLVSFDHDLAEPHYHESMFKDGKVYMKYLETVSEKTGMDCVKWMVDYCMDNSLKLPQWLTHSMNPVGRKNMDAYLTNFEAFLAKEKKCTCNGESCGCHD